MSHLNLDDLIGVVLNSNFQVQPSTAHLYVGPLRSV